MTVIQIFLRDIMGGIVDVYINPESDISILKDIAKSLYFMNDVDLIYNSKKLVKGTLCENSIVENSVIIIVGKITSGFSFLEKYKYEKNYEDFLKSQNMFEKLYDEITNNVDTESVKREMTPLEELETLHKYNYYKNVDSNDEEVQKDMCILFQKCQNQIEDEYIKEQQRKKENEKMSEKISILKEKMKKQKNKRLRLTNTNQLNDDKISKVNFCGSKKGFLL